ncbi:MAG: hypothetical protein ABR503_00370 [Chitinophagaceae bacterium]
MKNIFVNKQHRTNYHQIFNISWQYGRAKLAKYALNPTKPLHLSQL